MHIHIGKDNIKPASAHTRPDIPPPIIPTEGSAESGPVNVTCSWLKLFFKTDRLEAPYDEGFFLGLLLMGCLLLLAVLLLELGVRLTSPSLLVQRMSLAGRTVGFGEMTTGMNGCGERAVKVRDTVKAMAKPSCLCVEDKIQDITAKNFIQQNIESHNT
ncbi:S-adenosyl-L-methionine-dependentmethyltransferases superfamily protein [Striga asiatica]|uniref:S-adenosyl-L-methionine-dependentmethyltransferases superfamily protein n=1 Tax=Striga asiatica TaxID=4170 RepID=A0A5A7REN1_STRAF|nr:S-adenosyl-L-methionine-dependentmethyltransferases superfamily protein [Striga asiatica]